MYNVSEHRLLLTLLPSRAARDSHHRVMSYAPATNPPTSSKDGPLDAQTVEILQGGPPFDDDNDPWLGVGLRALLRSHGYRLRTLRDVALQCAADNGTAVPKKWGGPAREDDDPWLPSLVVSSIADANRPTVSSSLCRLHCSTDP